MEEKSIDIVALDFPLSVRTRPGMYIGATDVPDVILREVIDNSVDELMGSVKCSKIDIQLKEGQSGSWYVIADNGRGIPILMDKEKGVTKTELAVGNLNAGSKFHKGKDDISAGLNGVGVSCTNALSYRFMILSKITDSNYKDSIPEVRKLYESTNKGFEMFYVLEYTQGVKVNEFAAIRENIMNAFGFSFPSGMSTVVAFVPDPAIWKSTVASYSVKALSYVKVILDKFYNKTAQITIDGKLVDKVFEPYSIEFIKEVNVHDDYENRDKNAKFYINFEVAKDLSQYEVTGSVNSLIVNRGLHVDCAVRAFKEALRDHYHLTHDVLTAGLLMNVIVLTSEMDFSSQTKERCVKLDGLTGQEIITELRCEFHNMFAKDEDYWKTHIVKLNELADTMNKISAISKVKQVVGTVDGGNRVRSKLPSSVKDAASNDRTQCELFIVEGKSASGTMLQARNPEFHAILELRGVPLNAINLDLDTIMDNPEMCGIITAIGAGVNEYFRIENCRYGKVILAADSDIDGEKINSMILGFIARKMEFLLDDERVFIALAPLYQQGKTYVYPGEDPADILDMNKPFKRFKGIGEVNVAEARDFYFNENRNLLMVTKANLSYVFNLLTSSSYRKDLMMKAKVVSDPYNTGII